MNKGDESYDAIESLIDETLGYGTIRMSVLIYRLVLVLKLYGTINLMNPTRFRLDIISLTAGPKRNIPRP